MSEPAQTTPVRTSDRKVRAPSENRQSLVTPSLAQLLRARNGFGSRGVAFDDDVQQVSIGSVRLYELRRAARADAWQAANDYTRSYRDLAVDSARGWKGLSFANDSRSSEDDGRSLNAGASSNQDLNAGAPSYEGLNAGASSYDDEIWLVAGHQPELFHPGVWFKNYLLSEAGNQTSVVPLNLVIDNDLCRAPSIRVLCGDGTNQHFRTESVEFDAASPAVAWECRSILNNELLGSFPARVRQSMLPGLPEPLVDKLWPHVMTAARRTGKLGLALAQGRHILEGQLGLNSLELPLSQLCGQTSFARFSLAILADIARFQQVYNQQRAIYCAQNGIRSSSHPVPVLTTRHGWWEAPWWIYRGAEPTRRRLFVRLEGDDLLLSDQAGWQATIEGPLDSEDAVADWQHFAIDNVMLRPRALITTMYARLVISDLFMHGIGGGKYDQMTDAIIAQYFGIPAPELVVATATLNLPLGNHGPRETLTDNQAATRRQQADAWSMRYHPESFVADTNSEIDQLLDTKRKLLQNIPPRGQKWEWHHQITKVNQRLAELSQAKLQQSQSQLQELATRSRQLKLAYSREFSFCLFELGYVSDALQRLAAAEFFQPAAK